MPEHFRDEVLVIKALYKSTVTLLTDLIRACNYEFASSSYRCTQTSAKYGNTN